MPTLLSGRLRITAAALVATENPRLLVATLVVWAQLRIG